MSNKLRSPFGNFTPFTSHFHPLSKPSQDEIRPHKVDTIHFHEWKEELEMEEKQPVDLKAICATTEAGKVALCNCTTGEFDGSFVIPGRKNPNQVRIGWATTRQMLQANNNRLLGLLLRLLYSRCVSRKIESIGGKLIALYLSLRLLPRVFCWSKYIWNYCNTTFCKLEILNLINHPTYLDTSWGSVLTNVETFFGHFSSLHLASSEENYCQIVLELTALLAL